MEEQNELNDIILNKGGLASSNKKIILAVATLGVILVIVVMLMNSLSSNGTDNLPQAALPPKPSVVQADSAANEPLFEDVEVVEEPLEKPTNLDNIAKKLKEESKREQTTTPVTPRIKAPIAVKKHTVQKKKTEKKKVTSKTFHTSSYFIQVGSFSKYKPNKKFLKSITNLHYKYTYHKVKNLTKVLVGPFSTKQKARDAKRIIRAKIEPGAFLVKL